MTDRKAVNPAARSAEDGLVALQEVLDEAVAAGIDLIQIRERDVEARALRRFVEVVVDRARAGHTKVVVNDRADIAIAAGAGGVHLRADGPAVDRVRQLVGANSLVGRSIHSTGEIDVSADYLLFGTVFASASKPAGSPVAGVGALEEVARRTRVPVLAIGGITPDRVAPCRVAGAAGIAAIRAFLPAARTRDAIAAFRRNW